MQYMSRPKYQKLADSEIKKHLHKFTGWNIVRGKLSKTFEFTNFVQAFGFMTQVALEGCKCDYECSGNIRNISFVGFDIPCE